MKYGLSLLAACLFTLVAMQDSVSANCYFECVYEQQVGEYVFDYNALANCCWVEDCVLTTNGNGPCTGQHAVERTCYVSGWHYPAGAGCVCYGEGESEKCVQTSVEREEVTFACAMDDNCRPYCHPVHSGNFDPPILTSIPGPC